MNSFAPYILAVLLLVLNGNMLLMFQSDNEKFKEETLESFSKHLKDEEAHHARQTVDESKFMSKDVSDERFNHISNEIRELHFQMGLALSDLESIKEKLNMID